MKSLFRKYVRSLSILVLFFFYGGPTLSQSIDISLTPQYGTFKMNDLKKLQSEQASNIYDSLRVMPEKFYDFASAWGLLVNASLSNNRHNYSINIGYSTTGSRLHYKDYSGLIQIDKVIMAYNLAFGYSYLILDKSKFKLSTGLGVGISFSKLSANNTISIYVSNEVTNESAVYESRQFFVNPKLVFYYYPIKNMFIQLDAGYLYQIYSTNMEDLNYITLDWTGFRMGGGIGFRLNLIK